MLIKNLSIAAIVKLLAFGFTKEWNINDERQGGNASYGWFSFTPLMYAVYQGDLPLVKELIENKADLEKKDELFNFTALMWAALRGRYKVVSYLLTEGADIKHKAEWNGKMQDAYMLSKKEKCCSLIGFWQRAQKTLGIADIDKAHKVIISYRK